MNRTVSGSAEAQGKEPLLFFNGFGGFARDRREYVIRLDHREGVGLLYPPRPWINVIANETFGFLVSETGAGYTWCGNSREHRLTPWSNDPLSDPHGEALYLRDDESGSFWSPLPGPVPAAADYEMRHGLGYSICRHESAGIEQETLIYAARHAPVKFIRVRLVNSSRGARRLSLFSYARLVLGALPEESGRFVVTEHDGDGPRLFARNRTCAEFPGAVAFAAMSGTAGAWSFTADREMFIGCGGSMATPAAMRRGLDGRTGAGLDPCFAQQVSLELPEGGEAEVVFLLGEAGDALEARSLAEIYSRPGTAAEAFEETRSFWDRFVSGIHIETPLPELDLMVNGWLPYQALGCRIWGRSAFYQSGGAFGYRDQLQDAAALIGLSPEIARSQILLHSAHQFPEGDVLHWWHPPLSRGIRTRFADDLLWLPFVTADYVRATGDRAVLDEEVPFRSARRLRPGEDEAYLETSETGPPAGVYEHCCRALDISLTSGEHGLPLFGSGDWNDAMNRVGREGRGESVWMGFFLYAALGAFLPICASRGDGRRIARYLAFREKLREALDTGAWDGEWYRRGYYDNGEALGSSSCDECRMDTLSQSWAVISKAAPAEKAARAMEAARRLVLEEDGIIRLLDPPFDGTPNDPGYIKGYPPGVRENGGQYTHAALWVVKAAAELGWNNLAAEWLAMLSPIRHSATPEQAAHFRLEPYVAAADVCGVDPLLGRGGWSWYTGSAGWMYRVALESVLGFRTEGGDTIAILPCIPDAWPGYRLRYRLPGEETVFEIEVTNPKRCARSVVSCELDGAPIPIAGGQARVPIVRDGRTRRITITLGSGEGDAA
jgi:cyclic beta-1,2-glucan synthetase